MSAGDCTNDPEGPSENPRLEPYERLATQIVNDVETVHPHESVCESWPNMWENYLHACALLGCEPMKENP